ncbi:MAG: hypothetical protein DPW11_04580 [bacterium]|nr:hypothetical protein [bacterium]
MGFESLLGNIQKIRISPTFLNDTGITRTQQGEGPALQVPQAPEKCLQTECLGDLFGDKLD